jgi:hypothetical protein
MAAGLSGDDCSSGRIGEMGGEKKPCTAFFTI